MSAAVVEHLAKRYGHVSAVRDVSFEVPKGQLLAFLGPNGAGKTTTIDMLLGLTRPDAGSVSLFGQPPARAVAAGRVGGMLQAGSLLPYLTVRELIAMVASVYPHPLPVDEAIELAGVAELADRPSARLSGGQAQRVRFALAIIGDPDLLALDEPTAALDVEGRRDCWNAMRSFAARGRTVLFATHYLDEADAYADRIILIAHGRIVADGSGSEIKATVSGRTIRATLPDVAATDLSALTGVRAAERRGDAVVLSSADSGATLLALLARYPRVHDIEIHGVGLDEAFFHLTQDDQHPEGAPTVTHYTPETRRSAAR